LVLILPGLAAIRSAAQLGVQINLLFEKNTQAQDKNISLINRYILPAIPTVGAWLLVAALIDVNKENVSIFLSVGGILGSTIATGIVPMVLYKAVIQRNTQPMIPLLFLFRHRLAIMFNLIFFIIILLLYGLFIWDSLIFQILACLIAVMGIAQLFKLFPSNSN
jgi:hypothetical protein